MKSLNPSMKRTEKGLKVFLPQTGLVSVSWGGLTLFCAVLYAGAGVASMLLEASGKDSARIFLSGKGSQVVIVLMSHPCWLWYISLDS